MMDTMNTMMMFQAMLIIMLGAVMILVVVVLLVTRSIRSILSRLHLDEWPPKPNVVEAISSKPRAFIYRDFLSKEECQHLIDIAKPHMKRSRVVVDATGEPVIRDTRTSTGAALARGRDETVRKIEKRIAKFTYIPVEHGEGLQILHYQVGQKIDPHHDYFTLSGPSTKNGGQRVATVVMYLSDVEQGGETVFPEGAKGREVRVKPKMGDALLFWNMKPDHATLDPSSLHAGCPVIRGDKWLAINFMHLYEYKL